MRGGRAREVGGQGVFLRGGGAVSMSRGKLQERWLMGLQGW